MQQRYYDPRVARFWSVDPVTVSSVGGNFNRYWYGNGNPYRFTDPDGRTAQSPSGRMSFSECAATFTCDTRGFSTDSGDEPDKTTVQQTPSSDDSSSVGFTLLDAIFSMVMPSAWNANKRSSHPTKVPDQVAAREGLVNGAGLISAAGGQVVLPVFYGGWEATASVYDYSGMLMYRAAESPFGQRVALGSCLGLSMCMQGKTGEDPGQFAEDRERLAKMYHGTIYELQNMYQAVQH
jgi:hypothetical protein